MTIKNTAICLRLGKERKRLHLNQNKVATYCDVSVKTIGRWEKNIPIPADKLALLAKLGYDITYILTDVKLASQAAGLEAASEIWNTVKASETAQTGSKVNISKEQEVWLGILENMLDGDTNRLRQVGLALLGFSQANSEKNS